MKFLVNPLLWYLLVQSVGLVALQRRTTGRSRGWLRALLLLTLLLGLVSTPRFRAGLEASLQVPASASTAVAPAFIFVLGGGHVPGAIPDEDVLVKESQQRVLHGVAVWRKYPDARIVLSGAADQQGTRDADRLVQLMAETARSRGVPASAVLLEPRSRNTGEHPIQALRLPGVTQSLPIGVVTSGWHMRRARREFCRYFEHVQAYPVPVLAQPISSRDWLPDADSLGASTTLAREWVGMLAYAILTGPWHPAKC